MLLITLGKGTVQIRINKQEKGKSERTVSFDFQKKEIKSNLYFIIRNNIFCKF